jgi:hypothetical protein
VRGPCAFVRPRVPCVSRVLKVTQTPVCVPAPPGVFLPGTGNYLLCRIALQGVVAKGMHASARNSPRTLRPRTSSSSDSSRQVAHWLQLGTGKDGVLEASAWMSRSSLHDSQWVAGPARRSPFGGSIAYRSQIIPQQPQPPRASTAPKTARRLQALPRVSHLVSTRWYSAYTISTWRASGLDSSRSRGRVHQMSRPRGL